MGVVAQPSFGPADTTAEGEGWRDKPGTTAWSLVLWGGARGRAPLDGPDTAKAEDWSTASLYWWGMEDQLPTGSQQCYPCKGNETC